MGATLDGELFCGGITQHTLVTDFHKILTNNCFQKNAYALYPMLFKQKTNISYINDIDLMQDYFFNFFGGHNNSATVAKYTNSIVFGVYIIIIGASILATILKLKIAGFANVMIVIVSGLLLIDNFNHT